MPGSGAVLGLPPEQLVHVVVYAVLLGLTRCQHLWVQRQQQLLLSVELLAVVSLQANALPPLREHVPFVPVLLSAVPRALDVPA